ncbi:uncharacterized protein LOC129939548 [Eupeodes corollae]|uniref:uncharacterized protein LOC129939548 n=1 Tax=Eupeodes corollae TaxID=290404 RepID=UPI0024931A27|nr:uncharacterized protein LOC129939548 [Eupeodes corollae]XP_055903565.1 uncharacterized protein LOC129939548 [Eupeodes corollae]
MKMNSFNTNAHGFRSSKRKCSSLTGCLIFVLLMSQTSCRPSETDSDNSHSEEITYNDQDYMDADDLDWKTFADVETTSKVHPIIFYKEDIVSEDYDPSKEKKKTHEKHHVKEIKKHQGQKNKKISRRHNQTESIRYISPEKVYFDIHPIEHNVKDGGSSEDESSFDEDDIHVEVISLVDGKILNTKNTPSAEDQSYSKSLLNKNPNKINRRNRRDVTKKNEDATINVSLRHKRNPYYQRNSHYANQLPHYRGVSFHPQLVLYPINIKTSSGVKHPIKSPNYYNAYSPGGGNIINRRPTPARPIPGGDPESLDNRFDLDRPVWPIESNTTRPATTQAPPMRTIPPRRTPPPILQFGDEDYVTSAPPENRNTQSGAVAPSGFSSASSGSWSDSAPRTTLRPSVQSTFRPAVTSRPPAVASQPSASRGISSCIWAITSCCTSSEQIRYQCFERLGCSGAFWDLNPCADDILRLAVQAADQYLD